MDGARGVMPALPHIIPRPTLEGPPPQPPAPWGDGSPPQVTPMDWSERRTESPVGQQIAILFGTAVGLSCEEIVHVQHYCNGTSCAQRRTFVDLHRTKRHGFFEVLTAPREDT